MRKIIGMEIEVFVVLVLIIGWLIFQNARIDAVEIKNKNIALALVALFTKPVP